MDKTQPLKMILVYAKKLLHILSGHDRPSDLSTELLEKIDELTSHQVATSVDFQELDTQGTKLWNSSARLGKDRSESSQLVCLLRVFACLLLDTGQRTSNSPVQNVVRVFKSCLKCTKLCLDQGHIALAERAAETSAYYEELLRGQRDEENLELREIVSELSNEYFLSRIYLTPKAWRQNRLDLADYWLSKLNSDSGAYISALLAEKLADLLLEIGKYETGRLNHDTAVRWLERAYDAITGQRQEDLSSDAEDLQSNISHSLARALMQLPGHIAKTKALNIAKQLCVARSDKLANLILRLDLFDFDIEPVAENYCDVLLRVVHNVCITDSTLMTVLHYIHKLRARSPILAHNVLEAFLLERAAVMGNEDWSEKVLVNLIWNLTTSRGLDDEIKLLHHVLDALRCRLGGTIGLAATHAAQVLLWKRIELSYNQKAYSNSFDWCQLSMHEIFDGSSDVNRAKLQRKIILCAISASAYSKALQTYSEMPLGAKISEETQYLMYKLGLRSGDSELAARCLDSIYGGSAKDSTLLYACVLEAHQHGQKEQALCAMQKVLDKHDYDSPPGLHLPALLRCTARLLIQDIRSRTDSLERSTDSLCRLFEGAARQAKALGREPTNQTFTLTELDWFSRNTYNLAVKYCSHWSPSETLRLSNCCLKFMDLYPEDMDAAVLEDLSLRRMFCHFLDSCLCTVMARQEDSVEQQLQHYLGVRKHTRSFNLHRQSHMGVLAGVAREDITRKASLILVLEFEATVRLKAWHDVEQLVKDSQQFDDPKLYKSLADIMLCSDAPIDTTIAILQQIINFGSQASDVDTRNLYRWVRCLFQLTMTTKFELAECLLDQVSTLIDVERLPGTPEFPSEEIEWLATTAFNRAVDFYCVSRDADCKRWAEKALIIAKGAKDHGELHQILQTKYVGLRCGR